MNYIALIVGMFTVTYIIFRFKKTRLERTTWAYPMLLGSFPVYYFVFAVYAQDYKALGYEVAIGALFMAAAYFSYKTNRKLSFFVVGIFCVLHAAYDLFHHYLFINAVAPLWWLEFCGSIDVILGFYLILLARSLPEESLILNKNKA